MWTIKEIESEDSVIEFAKSNELNPVLARLLWLRDIKTKDAVLRFLNPRLEDLFPWQNLPDIEPSIKRIQQAISNKEKTVVWGHEDLDGISATVILYETIKALRGFPLYHIPTKGKDKHGLSLEKAKEFADAGAKLIITVDCGITNVEEVEQIKKLGIDVIITDHHEVLEALPNAIANIDPKRTDSKYPFISLAGVGIALKLAMALLDMHLKVKPKQLFSLKPDFLGLVALGTISDRVPLISENRILAKFGLEQMANIQNPAVNAILNVAGIERTKLTNDMFFSDILPIFASANGNVACDYILNKNYEESLIWAQELNNQSQTWREEAKQTLLLAEQVVDLSPGILIVKDERLSLRALGHVAGKLKDRYQVPALIMGPKNNDWVGECRGINGVDLIELLKANREYFSAFGGHKKACGFTVSKKLADNFIKSAKQYAKEHFVNNIIRENRVIPDAFLPVKELTKDFVKLGPFGEGNPEPIFISQNTALSKSNGKYTLLERPELNVIYTPDQHIYSDRVFVDILYSIDEYLDISILKIDYTQ
jgi:single-stranded-DNA-specific exonuclease